MKVDLISRSGRSLKNSADKNNTKIANMKRVLLTGISGTGKTSVVDSLSKHGFSTIDMDDPGWSYQDQDGHQLWYEAPLQSAINSAGEVLFISGCSETQVKFYPQFTDIILLSSPIEILLDRLENRTNNPYGKLPEQLTKILSDLENIEPLLRLKATLEISTICPLDEVVEKVLVHVFQEK